MNIDDEARMDFLNDLATSSVALTEWEAKFIDDMLAQHIEFTDRMRAKIDQMRKRYQRDL